MKSRHVTICKDINGEMRYRSVPIMSWNMIKGRKGANDWKECIPTIKAEEDFPELKQSKVVIKTTNPELDVQVVTNEVYTYESLMKWPMKELVTLGGIGMKKKEEIVQHILKKQ